MNISPVLGVDIGGSHITSAMVDIHTGLPVAGTETRIHVNSSGSADEIISAWTEAILKSIGTSTDRLPEIGIAMPGPFDYENGICLIKEQEKFKSLYRLNLKSLIARKLSTEPARIHFMNDACAFLEGEMTGGALRNKENVMGITLGTGLGSAFSNGNGITDADLWNKPYLDGIAEDFLSTRWFTNRFAELTGSNISGVKELVGLSPVLPVCEIIFREFGANLAGFMMAQFDEHAYSSIVVGGNIAKAADLFCSHCDQSLLNSSSKLSYTLSQLGEKAALTGAAAMAHRRQSQRTSDYASRHLAN